MPNIKPTLRSIYYFRDHTFPQDPLMVCQRVVDLEARLSILALASAEERLGYLLLHLVASDRNMKGKHEGDVELVVDHHSLAQMTALSRPHLTVTMGRFRRLKLVDYQQGSPLKVSVSALQRYLEREFI